MQTTHSLNPNQIKPLKGWIFGEAILGQYETESGILVVKDLKKNPKIDKIKVVSTGGRYEDRKGRAQTYWARPGETAWMKRGTAKKVTVQGKTFCFVRNEDIVAGL